MFVDVLEGAWSVCDPSGAPLLGVALGSAMVREADGSIVSQLKLALGGVLKEHRCTSSSEMHECTFQVFLFPVS